MGLVALKVLLVATSVMVSCLTVDCWILRLPCKKEADFNVAIMNFKLQNNIITKFTRSDYTACVLECIKNYNCMSLNYKLAGGKDNCELNGSTIEKEKMKVTANSHNGWLYYSTDYNTTKRKTTVLNVDFLILIHIDPALRKILHVIFVEQKDILLEFVALKPPHSKNHRRNRNATEQTQDKRKPPKPSLSQKAVKRAQISNMLMQLREKTTKPPKTKTSVKINAVQVPILVDTGATVDIIDEKTLDTMNNKVKLEKTNTKIYPYGSKTPLPLKGQFQGTIESKSRYTVTQIYVVEGAGGNLLSAKTAQDLNLIQIVNRISGEATSSENKCEEADSEKKENTPKTTDDKIQPKQNSFTPRYNPRRLKVIEKRGNRVTAQRENFKITRNISYFKKVPAEDIQEESDEEYDNRENHPEEEQDVQYRRSGRQRVENLAVGKPSKQSSTYGSFGAHRANDGNEMKILDQTALTNNNNNPWWNVDLTRQALVTGIIVIVIVDTSPIDIRAGKSGLNNGLDNPHCAQGVTVKADDGDKYLCPPNTIARYVTIQLLAFLNFRLCEVKVYGIYIE
eukprot:gene17947-19737_t